MDRQQAWALVCQYTASDSLRKHMLAVEAAMRAYARRYGADEETWGIVGLLHDFDYERWPNPPDHPLEGAAILAEHGYPDHVIYAIKSHADYLTDCPRVSQLDKTLYACDELAGFVTAVAKVRPADPPIDRGLPVTTLGTENPSRVEYVSMIHAMTCSFVPRSGAGMSFSGPISGRSSEVYRRVMRWSSFWDIDCGSQMMPPFAPP